MAKTRKVDIRAAGALVWRPRGRTIEVLLVHRPRYDDWSFPKGKLKPGETIRECCIREIKEETGVNITLGVPAGWCYYETPEGNWKEVRYWMASVADPDRPSIRARKKVRLASPKEIDEARWVKYKRAKKMLTIADDLDMLGRLHDLWNDDKLTTTPLLLVRHTRAQKRSAWKEGKGSEETRPLTPTGAQRAKQLNPVLSAYGVDQLISSPWKRCMDTLSPYAKWIGVDIEKIPDATEHAHEKNPKKLAKLIHKLFVTRREPIAMCLHRPTLPTVMDVLEEYTPHAIMRQIPKTDPWMQTGEIIIAHVAHREGKRPTVVAYEKARPLIERPLD
ncbi:MAG: NUDIX hydrolase [Actinomycetaceae bacterium]|nr:NUDIX hydrolase [Actinomycetaceae bacterium]